MCAPPRERRTGVHGGRGVPRQGAGLAVSLQNAWTLRRPRSHMDAQRGALRARLRTVWSRVYVRGTLGVDDGAHAPEKTTREARPRGHALPHALPVPPALHCHVTLVCCSVAVVVCPARRQRSVVCAIPGIGRGTGVRAPAGRARAACSACERGARRRRVPACNREGATPRQPPTRLVLVQRLVDLPRCGLHPNGRPAATPLPGHAGPKRAPE